MDEQKLRKAGSNASFRIDEGEDLEAIAKINEVDQVECECCGLKEDCTLDYIMKVKNAHSGTWVCGLCSEAVKERLRRAPRTSMEEAVSTHKFICGEFNSTTRLNPKLSLTWVMRDIAKRSYENRSSTKIVRSASCDPRIDLT